MPPPTVLLCVNCVYDIVSFKKRFCIYLLFSLACKDLVQRFLTFDREKRITLEEALDHEWLQKGYDGPVIPIMFPNYPRDDEMDKNIMRHMVDKMEFKHQEIVEAVTQNR